MTVGQICNPNVATIGAAESVIAVAELRARP